MLTDFGNFFRETTEDLRVTAIPFFMGHQKKESGADSYWVSYDMNSLLLLLRITKTFFFFIIIAVEVQHPYWKYWSKNSSIGWEAFSYCFQFWCVWTSKSQRYTWSWTINDTRNDLSIFSPCQSAKPGRTYVVNIIYFIQSCIFCE